MPLALYTFGLFIHPAEHPANGGFYELNDPIFEIVDKAPGLIARSGYASDAGPNPWGKEIYPHFYEEKGDGWCPATLSLWTDIESLFHFTYYGLHKTALKRGKEWFQNGDWPPLVLWWHKDNKTYPTWSDAVERYEQLHDNGPTPDGFNIKTLFDEHGQRFKIEIERVKFLSTQENPCPPH